MTNTCSESIAERAPAVVTENEMLDLLSAVIRGEAVTLNPARLGDGTRHWLANRMVNYAWGGEHALVQRWLAAQCPVSDSMAKGALAFELALERTTLFSKDDYYRFISLLSLLKTSELFRFFHRARYGRNRKLAKDFIEQVMGGRFNLDTCNGNLKFNVLVLGYTLLSQSEFKGLCELMAGVGRLADCADPAAAVRYIAKRFVDGAAISTPSFFGRDKHLKIALCVSGQLRGYEEAFRSWSNLRLDGHEVDTFVHVWRDIGVRVPHHGAPETIRRAFASPAFCEAYRKYGHIHGLQKIRAHYPALFERLVAAGQADERALQKLYGERAVIMIDDEAQPFFQGFTNPHKMYFKISQAHKLAERAGKKYDLVIRIRPDKLIAKAEVALDWHAVCDYSMRNGVVFEEAGRCFQADLHMNDQLAIGGWKVMSAYANTLDNLSRLGRCYGVPSTPVPHASMAYQSLYSGLTIERLADLKTAGMANMIQLDTQTIRSLLEQDVARRTPTDLDVTFLAALTVDAQVQVDTGGAQ